MSEKQDSGRYKKLFDILGLPPDAISEEIREAYLSLKEKYSGGSDENSQSMLREIEEAYRVLAEEYVVVRSKVSETGGKSKKTEMDVVAETDGKFAVFTGPALRAIREKQNIEFDDITRVTKISPRMINAIENENFDALPPEVYVRGFLKGYAAFLSLDVSKVVKDYMGRYGTWKKGSEKNRLHFRFARKKGAFSIQAKK